MLLRSKRLGVKYPEIQNVHYNLIDIFTSLRVYVSLQEANSIFYLLAEIQINQKGKRYT